MNETRILDLFKNQTHKRESLSIVAGAGFAENSHCGDEVWFAVAVESGALTSIKYNGRACSMTLASAEFIARTYTGGSIPTKELLTEKLLSFFDIDADHRRYACVILPITAFFSAVQSE